MMRQHGIFVVALLLPSSWDFSAKSNIFAKASVLVINEVAYGGSGESNCNGKDWIELLFLNSNNTGLNTTTLTNYFLRDDNGVDNSEYAKIFEGGVTMAPGEFLILCEDDDFTFDIGTTDTIAILDADGILVDTVTLPGNSAGRGTETVTYSFLNGQYKYTATPTPGKANIYTEQQQQQQQLPMVPKNDDNDDDDPSGNFVESEICGSEFAGCALAATCFDHQSGNCDAGGEIQTDECQKAVPCKVCYPHSRCGPDQALAATDGNKILNENANDDSSSSVFIETADCGPGLAMCAEASSCFDHDTGCAEDGTTTVAECRFVLPTCKPCFPKSRCGQGVETEAIKSSSDEESSLFVGSDDCGPELALCAGATPCFDHASGACAEDGSMLLVEDCNSASQFCKPCFPFSRCGLGKTSLSNDAPLDPSAVFVPGDDCGPELVLCQEGGICFDHTQACAVDGSVDMSLRGAESCQLALDFCIPCFPNSRCGSGGDLVVVAEDKQDFDEAQEVEQVESTDGETSASEATSGAHCPGITTITILSWILPLVGARFLGCWIGAA